MKTLTSNVLAVPTPQAALRNCGLAHIDFSDGYRGRIGLANLTSLQVARAVFDNPPRWVVALMSVRNRVVAPFGLKTPQQLHKDTAGQRLVGIFPLLSESEEEVILGGDDRHLDFRIWASVRADQTGCEVTISTLVHINNSFGRGYLFAVMPFHGMLSRYMLRRGLRHIADTPDSAMN